MTANCLVPVCFSIDQINLNNVKERKIPFELNDNNIVLYLKAVLDGGAFDNLVSDKGLGYCLSERGTSTQVKSILDEKFMMQGKYIVI